MSITERLISPLPINLFMREYFSKRPYAAPFVAKEFQGLIGWPILSEIITAGHRNCWLVKHGRFLSDLSNGEVSKQEMMRAYDNGYTFLVRHAENAHPALAVVAHDFFKLFNKPIDIQLYSTPAQQVGFDWHYDLEDVFVIQSSGEKEFFLRKNKIPFKQDKVKIPKTYEELIINFEGPMIHCHLKAGDCLYIPAGYWHKARALTESHHMSIGVLA